MEMSSFAVPADFILGAVKPSAAVQQLQRALTTLAFATGDKAFIVKVDGVMGPATAAAVNRGLSKVARAAPANLRTGKLTQAQIVANAATITAALVAAANAQSGTRTPVAAKAPAPKAAPAPRAAPVAARASKAEIKRLQLALRTLGAKIGDKTLVITADGLVGPKTIAAVARVITTHAAIAPVGAISAATLTPAFVTTLAKAVEAKAAAVSKPVPAASAKPTKSPTVQRLQQAVTKLGQVVKDKALALTADGLIGPKTAAAVNRALRTYVTGAPANLRTGTLAQADIVAQAATLAPLVETEIVRRGAKPPVKPATAPSKTVKRSSAISQLQADLNALARAVNDPGLTVVVDGINGPKTTAAVNRALAKYVPAADVAPALKKGNLSVAFVSANAGELQQLLAATLASRGVAEPPPPAEPPPEPEGVEEPTVAPSTSTAPAGEDVPSAPGPSATRPAVTVPAPVAPQAPMPPPLAPASALAPGGGGGGGGAEAPGAGGEAAPGAEAPEGEVPGAPEAAKPFPWVPVLLIGTGAAAALGATLYFTMRKPGASAARAPQRRPGQRRRSTRRYASGY